ncbi:hypothetical protein AB0E67_12160 [Streptomyces sp. NPDC032161]
MLAAPTRSATRSPTTGGITKPLHILRLADVPGGLRPLRAPDAGDEE